MSQAVDDLYGSSTLKFSRTYMYTHTTYTLTNFHTINVDTLTPTHSHTHTVTHSHTHTLIDNELAQTSQTLKKLHSRDMPAFGMVENLVEEEVGVSVLLSMLITVFC